MWCLYLGKRPRVLWPGPLTHFGLLCVCIGNPTVQENPIFEEQKKAAAASVLQEHSTRDYGFQDGGTATVTATATATAQPDEGRRESGMYGFGNECAATSGTGTPPFEPRYLALGTHIVYGMGWFHVPGVGREYFLAPASSATINSKMLNCRAYGQH